MSLIDGVTGAIVQGNYTACDHEKCFHITEFKGKQIQEILHRYRTSLKEYEETTQPEFIDQDLLRENNKDIEYIRGLAKLFD